MRYLAIVLILIGGIELGYAKGDQRKKIDWSVLKSGNVGLTFVFRDKSNDDSFTYYDKRDGRSGVVWAHTKVTLTTYENPVLIAVFGHGAQSFVLKIIDPLKPEDRRVLFEQESVSDMPTYEIVGSRPNYKGIKITYGMNVPHENPKYKDFPNTEFFDVEWPKGNRDPQSKSKKK